jgi:hypothetical protein
VDPHDIIAIQQLMALYGHAADEPEQGLLPLVFTPDAVFDAGTVGWGEITGLDAIVAWFMEGKPPHPPSHHSTNVYAYEDGGETRVRSKWMILNSANGTVLSGDYDDVIVRTPAGWRIARRTVKMRYPANPGGKRLADTRRD